MTTDDYLNESNTKFCVTCGSKIHEKAEICPNCGVRCADIESNEAKKSSNNYFHKSAKLAVVGIILGIFFSFIGYFFVGFMYAFSGSSLNVPLTFLGFGLLTSVFAVFGIVIEKYNMKIAATQYIICAIFLLITGYLIIGLIPAICLIIAGILAFQNKSDLSEGVI
ncbi:hypothetical protein KQY27_03245 [Methanobrevibacter sp. TMH8]|uniref:hypothetical protein n=1 Tax=Methanobrevibacter sp. TMH8 TaxID=2848611 RepID=UPI001CC90B1B|nr:hypothetical protein [Methanobrevibacter sp. TMH8]MBZ9570560.1 hypothetical protein [Methanobrevibacter sp. TMH8]